MMNLVVHTVVRLHSYICDFWSSKADPFLLLTSLSLSTNLPLSTAQNPQAWWRAHAKKAHQVHNELFKKPRASWDFYHDARYWMQAMNSRVWFWDPFRWFFGHFSRTGQTAKFVSFIHIVSCVHMQCQEHLWEKALVSLSVWRSVPAKIWQIPAQIVYDICWYSRCVVAAFISGARSLRCFVRLILTIGRNISKPIFFSSCRVFVILNISFFYCFIRCKVASMYIEVRGICCFQLLGGALAFFPNTIYLCYGCRFAVNRKAFLAK